MLKDNMRTWAVIKREFLESVRTKAFVLGTIFGPVLIIGVVAAPVLFADEGGGIGDIVIVDATEAEIGDAIASALPDAGPPASTADSAPPVEGWRFNTDVLRLAGLNADSVRSAIQSRIEREELDGYLWLAAGVVFGNETVVYEGTNATSMGQMSLLEATVQSTIREHRLNAAGFEPARVRAALRPVGFEARKTGDDAASGSAESTFILAWLLGFAIYMVVIIYGQSVMRGVLEEKRDRIAEITMSSIRAPQLMVGKLLGIGGAGILQFLIWLGFGALVLARGETIATNMGFSLPELPQVPLRVAITFLVYFAGGFLLYSVLYAAVGAMVTSDQEAQQLALPVLSPLIVAILMVMPVLMDPTGTLAVVGSLIPLTSPVIMPMRATVTAVPLTQIIGGVALLIATVAGFVWLAAKIYRVGMLSTGKKPSMRELVRWVRAA